MQEFNSSGTYVMQFGSTSIGGAAYFEPQYLTIDPSGNIWVTDTYDKDAMEFGPCGAYLSTFGSWGTGAGQWEGGYGISVYPATPGGGGACVASLTPPSSGEYTTGQTLTFTVTYNQAVTVSGTPQLVLGVGSNTRYANYSSGSGTTTLTFTYTVQASDVANNGLTSTGTINLNGGTITTVNNSVAANLTYTSPAMGGVVLNATSFMLVADVNGNRVQALTLGGSYIEQLGGCASGQCSSGIANGAFDSPFGIAIDASGDIWVTDESNNRVQEFSSNGTWLASLGGTSSACSNCLCTSSSCPTSGGTGNGQFSASGGPSGIAINTTTGNIWVLDDGNFRIEEFSSSGSYLGQVGGTYGCGNGQMEYSSIIHLDSSNNLWLGDTNCNDLEEFNSSGSYVKTIGPTLPGYGTFSSVAGFNFDSCGNIWMVDNNNGNLVKMDYEGNFVQSTSLSASGSTPDLAISSGDTIYALSEGNHGVATYNSSGSYVSFAGGYGTGNGKFENVGDFALVGTSPTRLAISNCPAVILSAAGPSSGNYVSGGTLGFAVTYDQDVTVNTTGGTPYIPITINGVAEQASYVSGSGTTTLTFQYTVQSSDAAKSGGVVMDVPIELNGGTVMNGSNNADVYFQPPTITGVTVGTTYQVVLTSASSSPWTVPANWNSSLNTIEALGCGGNGAQGATAGAGGPGGGGGEYREASNVSLSGTVSFTVPAAGTGGGGAGTGNSTSFGTTVKAYCGGNGSGTTARAAGSSGTGSAAHANGGAGGHSTNTTESGGGSGGSKTGNTSGVGGQGGAGLIVITYVVR